MATKPPVHFQGEVVIASHNRIASHAHHSDSAEQATGGDSLALTGVFTSDCVETIPSGTKKADVIRRLVQLLANHKRLDPVLTAAITRQVLQRESYGSSAIGKGLAFPHLRTSEVQCFVGAIGVASEGLDFESLDHEPTKLVFLTLSPLASRQQHMDLLGRLVSLMRDKAMSMQLHHRIQPHDIYRYLRDLDDQSEAAFERRSPSPGRKADD